MQKIHIHNRKNIKYILEKVLPVQARYSNRSHRLSSNIDLVQNSFNLSNPPASRNCCLPTSEKEKIRIITLLIGKNMSKRKNFSGLQKTKLQKKYVSNATKKVDCKISQKGGRTVFKVLMQKYLLNHESFFLTLRNILISFPIMYISKFMFQI